MRVAKPMVICVPRELYDRLEKNLRERPPKFSFEKSKFYALIKHVNLKSYHKGKRKNSEPYIALDREYLKGIIGSNFPKYVKYLTDLEVLLCDNHYVKGNKSFHYKINRLFMGGVKEVYIEHNKKAYERIIKWQRNKRKNYNRLQRHLLEMQKKIMKFQFDYEGAKKWVLAQEGDRKKFAYLNSIIDIRDGRFRHFNRNSTNDRLDTNLTNLKKELRSFIQGEYVSIDLCNAQPYFLGRLIFMINEEQMKSLEKIGRIRAKRNNRKGKYQHMGGICWSSLLPNPFVFFDMTVFEHGFKLPHSLKKCPEMLKYYQAVKNGSFYEDFEKELKGKNTREEVKVMMYQVLFSRNLIEKDGKESIPYEKNKAVFKSVFPRIAEIVEKLKEVDHRKLAIFLQKMEAFVFIDVVAKKLCESGIIPFTIHDSVIVERNEKEQALKIINESFTGCFGEEPQFKVENL